jgi:ParB family chromosome partitioning protein
MVGDEMTSQHYTEKATELLGLMVKYDHSERSLAIAAYISKSEIHRMITIAKMSAEIKHAAKEFNIEKYVLLELVGIKDLSTRKSATSKILSGEIRRRKQLRDFIKYNKQGF